MGQRGEGYRGTCYWSPESPVKWRGWGGGALWRPSSRRVPCEGVQAPWRPSSRREGEEQAVLGAAWGWRVRLPVSCSFADYEEPLQLGLGAGGGNTLGGGVRTWDTDWPPARKNSPLKQGRCGSGPRI